jgi:hypothetical protein
LEIGFFDLGKTPVRFKGARGNVSLTGERFSEGGKVS